MKDISNYNFHYPLTGSILRKAMMIGAINVNDLTDSIIATAEEIASYHADDEEIGSSDMTFIVKEFLDGIGFKTYWENDRLAFTKPNKSGKGMYANGGDLGKEVYWYVPFHAYEKNNLIMIYAKNKDKVEVVGPAKDLSDAKFQIDNMQEGYGMGLKYLEGAKMEFNNGYYYLKAGGGLHRLGKNENISKKKFLLIKKGAQYTSIYANGGGIPNQGQYAKGGGVSYFRVNNSAALKLSNFNNYTAHINLIRLKSQKTRGYGEYKDDNKYAIEINGFGDGRKVMKFKNLEEAEIKYEQLLKQYSMNHKLDDTYNTHNYANGMSLEVGGKRKRNIHIPKDGIDDYTKTDAYYDVEKYFESIEITDIDQVDTERVDDHYVEIYSVATGSDGSEWTLKSGESDGQFDDVEGYEVVALEKIGSLASSFILTKQQVLSNINSDIEFLKSRLEISSNPATSIYKARLEVLLKRKEKVENSYQYAKGGRAARGKELESWQMSSLWKTSLTGKRTAEKIKTGSHSSIRNFMAKKGREYESMGFNLEMWPSDATEEEVLRYTQSPMTATSQQYAKGGGVDDESIMKKVRKYNKDGLLEITRSGILGNDFKTKDDRVVVKQLENKVGGFNAYKIIVDGKEIEGLFTLSQSYKFIVDFIENKYANGGKVLGKIGNITFTRGRGRGLVKDVYFKNDDMPSHYISYSDNIEEINEGLKSWSKIHKKDFNEIEKVHFAKGGGVGETPQDILHELVSDMNSDQYEAFCYEYKIGIEDANEMASFISQLDDKEAKKIIKMIESRYFGADDFAKGGGVRSKAAIAKDRKYFNKNEKHEVAYANRTGRYTQSYNRGLGIFAKDGMSTSSNDFYLEHTVTNVNRENREVRYDISISYNKEFNSVIIKELDYTIPNDPYPRTLQMPFGVASKLYSMLDKMMSYHVYGKEMAKHGKMVASVYNVALFDKNGHFVAQTQIDHKSESLAWKEFEESGHKKQEGMYMKWEKETDPDEISQSRMFRRGGLAADGAKISKQEENDYYHILDVEQRLVDGEVQIDGKELSPEEAKEYLFKHMSKIIKLGRKGWNPFDTIYIIEGDTDETDDPEAAEQDAKTLKAADGAEIDAMVNDWKAVKKVLGGAGEGNPKDMKVLDIDSNTIHKPIMIDYEQDMVIMENPEYGRTGNSIGKVKFFFDAKPSAQIQPPAKKVLTPAEILAQKSGMASPAQTSQTVKPAPTLKTKINIDDQPPIEKAEKSERGKYYEMLKDTYNEAKGEGVVLISASYMDSIEEAILEKLSELSYQTMLNEVYEYLTKNGIVLKSKIFMNKIKNTLTD